MERYQVLNDEFINTGGHVMVHTTTVYDRQAMATRFVLIGEDSIVLATADFVQNELEDDFEQYVIVDIDPAYLVCEPAFDNHACVDLSDDEWLLLKTCQFKYITAYCKYFNTRMHLAFDEFPSELTRDITVECIEWHHENEQLFSTDGTDCKPSEGYTRHVNAAAEKTLKQAKAFKNFLIGVLEDDKLRESLYDKFIRIELNGQTCEIPFGADEFNHLDELVSHFIAENE